MGYIKEPKGIDFIIQSAPLTDEARQAFSSFIAADKARRKKEAGSKRKTARAPKSEGRSVVA